MQKITNEKTFIETKTTLHIDELVHAIKISLNNPQYREVVLKALQTPNTAQENQDLIVVKEMNKENFLTSLRLTAEKFGTENEVKYINKMIKRIKDNK